MSTIDQALEAVLNKIKDGSQNNMREAEAATKQWETENLPGYSYSLAVYMSDTQKDPANRQLCGVLLKGTIWSKEASENGIKQAKWFEKMPDEAKNKIRISIYTLLNDSASVVAGMAAQIIAKIALIELPHGQWLDLIGALLSNMQNQQASPSLKKATLDTLGYICEEINSDALQGDNANLVLAAIVHGMRPEETNKEVKLAACTALLLALNFGKKSFETPNVSQVIFDCVIAALEFPENEIRIAAYAVLTEITELHYDKLAPQMQKLFKITLEAIQRCTEKKEEDVCKFAIEFWTTVCDEEYNYVAEIAFNKENNLPPPDRVSQFFVRGALQYLVPLLANCLCQQSEDDDPDDYTIPMAAGVCLTLIAQTVGDDVVAHIMPFVEQNLLSTEWKHREAAVLAFGSSLEGPKGVIHQLIQQATPVLLKHLKDVNENVKDTSAWAIANILRLHPEAVTPIGEQILKNLCETLGDSSSRVAGKACLGIHNFALYFHDEKTNPIGKHFVDVVRMLLLCADRSDSDEENLRTSAYEALNVVLDSAPDTAEEPLGQILKLMVERLEKTFALQIVNQDDQNNQIELQGLLCGVIQVLVTRLDKKFKPLADAIMTQLIRLFRSRKDGAFSEEGMLTVNAIVTVMELDFQRYMTDLLPHLLVGLSNWQAHTLCNIIVGIIGDIARALGHNMAPYCDQIITVLLTNLQNRDLDRAVKPTILSVFGDVAWAIGGGFDKYLQIVMHMLKQAADTVMKTQIPDDDDDLIDYINLLRDGICEAYTGINQGMRADHKVDKMYGYLGDVCAFVLHIANEKQCNESVRRAACGIIGDLILSFQDKVKTAVTHNDFQRLMRDTSSNSEYSKETTNLARWALNLSRNL
jgi:importin subunit beta-1